MKRLITAVCFVFVLAGVTAAQDATQMPKPGPEQKRLQHYVGTWNVEYEIKPGPMGAGGKMTGTDRSQWLPGGFFVVTHAEGKGSMGEMKGLSIMGYNAEEKVYTYDAFNNFGEAEHFKGTAEGDSLIWTSESKMAGKPTKMRFTAKEISPTMYTMKLEMGADSGWTTVMEGKATKAK
ncbi:MAG: DUF1579 family protein [Acidobacteriota bacterium]